MMHNDSVTRIYTSFKQANESILGLEAIDYFFAKEMSSALVTSNTLLASNDVEFSNAELANQSNLFHLFLALSVNLRAGHSCLSVESVADTHWGKGFESVNPLSHAGFVFSRLSELTNMLLALNIQASDQQLLVFEQGNLYLRRYFKFEADLADAINSRLSAESHYDEDLIENCICQLFPKDTSDNLEIDWQKVAVANAINKDFSVIAGGPGTGKTYTVTKLLAAIIMLEQQSSQNVNLNKGLKIALVAPTGKAAQRLSESIVDAVNGFKGNIDDSVLSVIPTKAQTIHRLLGVIPNSPNFRHNEDQKLAYDIVLIDEVSMVDLPLMTRIFRALTPSTKVILLGDADQLPSVAAGSVLADIAPRPHYGYSADNKTYLEKVCQFTPEQAKQCFNDSQFCLQVDPTQSLPSTNENSVKTADYLSFLVKSRRFDGKGGIGLIANAVIQGNVKASWQLLELAQVGSNQEASAKELLEQDKDQSLHENNNQLSLAEGELQHWLAPLVKQYYKPITACDDVGDAFNLLAQFRVLCATRQGDFGVENLNKEIEAILGKNTASYQQDKQVLYHGQPIMINENDYRVGLYNGDIGILWHVTDDAGAEHLMACFESEEADKPVRMILPSRLPKFESVYAMTIHKTQGSEFSHVAMILSETESESHNKTQKASKLLTRELLYTGITRAKKKLTISANKNTWKQGVTGQVKRSSGLNLG